MAGTGSGGSLHVPNDQRAQDDEASDGTATRRGVVECHSSDFTRARGWRHHTRLDVPSTIRHPFSRSIRILAFARRVRHDHNVDTDTGRPRALPPGAQAISFLGDTLSNFRCPRPHASAYEAQLGEANAAYDHAPTNADSIIWFGRRLAYLGRIREAIDVYSRGIALYPDNPWLYRHRGHRICPFESSIVLRPTSSAPLS